MSATNQAAFAAAREAKRKQCVRAIKASQRQLGLDDGTYRDMLQAQTRSATQPGKRSASDLTLQEAAKVLDWMRRQGAINPKQPNRAAGKRRPAPSPDRAPLMAKVHALLTALGEATGQPHGLGYADAICKRNGWADAVDFCRTTDLHLLVGALSRTLRHRQEQAQAKAAPATSEVTA